MKRDLYVVRVLLALVPFLTISNPARAILANRVFVSARSGNDANFCNSILTPCQTFAGAVVQLNPGGEAIVLDSGGYGPVTITQAVTIEAAPGVTAFIHPPSGDAVTVNAGASDVVVLRGLVLNTGTGNGVTVNSVGTLDVENCSVTGFSSWGIYMHSAGRLHVKGTDVKTCGFGGVGLAVSSGVVQASIDRCHLDGNSQGFAAISTGTGHTTTTASNSTANGNAYGWVCGNATSGADVLNLEFCTASENSVDGLLGNSTNAQSMARFSNCIFSDNGVFGVIQVSAAVVQSRGNNTVTGNGTATSGTIGSFSPM